MSDHCVHCDTALGDLGEMVSARDQLLVRLSDEIAKRKWAYSDGQRDGAENEREAIVAWLEDAKRGDLSGRYLAAFIERGDHVGGDDE